MLEVIQTIVALVVTLSILVTIHEYGHYLVARLCNVHVLRFSVGFGKPLVLRRGKPPVPLGQGDEAAKDASSWADLPGGDQTGAGVDEDPSVPVISRSNEPLAGTEFAVAAIPLGGYVKMLDEREGFVPDDLKHLAFNRKNVWQRIAIVSAGPIANFLLAIVAYWMLFTVGVTGLVPVLGQVEQGSPAAQAGLQPGQRIVAVDGEPTASWSEVNLRLFDHLGETGTITFTAQQAGSSAQADYAIEVQDWLSDQDMPYPAEALGIDVQYPPLPAIVGGLAADGSAQAAGLLPGDEIYSINDERVIDWSHLVELVQASPDQRLALEVLREGSIISIQVTPKGVEREGRKLGYLGVSVQAAKLPDDMLVQVSHPFYSAWIPAVQKTWEVTIFSLDALKKMVIGAISPTNLAGPVTIARVANDSAENGLEAFISFLALLSISLGVINLLPIPVLDGGHLLYYLIELAAGRPLPEKVQAWGLQIGMALIFSVMIFAIVNDLMRL